MPSAPDGHLSERVEHAGWLGVVSYDDGEWVIVWRPKDPKWRSSAGRADVETISSPIYSQAVEEWEVSVDTYADIFRDGSCGNAS